MVNSADILRALAAPFPPANVSWRVGSTSKDGKKGMALCYIDARDVQRRLDLVMGYNWADELVVMPGLVTCRIGLLIDGSWIWRQDGTATVRESLSDGDLSAKKEQEREMSLKGSASDAFKRAAVKWGIGRYLYDIASPWVEVNEFKQITDDGKRRLLGIMEQHYVDWKARNAAAPKAAAPAPQPEPRETASANGHDHGDDLPEPGADEPGLLTDEELKRARQNNDFSRIEQLLERNPRTVGDVTRIVNAPMNLEAIKSWPKRWQDYMRECVRAARERAEANKPAAESAAA